MAIQNQHFSIVVPTLQRSPRLWPLINVLATHPLVDEIVIINNAPDKLSFPYPNVRVLDQECNIFVNPAWNLGAGVVKSDLLAILNDDVGFDPALLTCAARLLRFPWIGSVGVDGAFVNRAPARKIRTRLATYEHVALGFGMFMCMRRKDYVPIPDDVKIWGGDDWLFVNQRLPSVVLQGMRFETEMSTTSGSTEFQKLRDAETLATGRMVGRVLGTRWWHTPVRLAAQARRFRWRLAAAVTFRRLG